MKERIIVTRKHVIDHEKNYNLKSFSININKFQYLMVEEVVAKYEVYIEETMKRKLPLKENLRNPSQKMTWLN